MSKIFTRLNANVSELKDRRDKTNTYKSKFKNQCGKLRGSLNPINQNTLVKQLNYCSNLSIKELKISNIAENIKDLNDQKLFEYFESKCPNKRKGQTIQYWPLENSVYDTSSVLYKIPTINKPAAISLIDAMQNLLLAENRNIRGLPTKLINLKKKILTTDTRQPTRIVTRTVRFR